MHKSHSRRQARRAHAPWRPPARSSRCSPSTLSRLCVRPRRVPRNVNSARYNVYRQRRARDTDSTTCVTPDDNDCLSIERSPHDGARASRAAPRPRPLCGLARSSMQPAMCHQYGPALYRFVTGLDSSLGYFAGRLTILRPVRQVSFVRCSSGEMRAKNGCIGEQHVPDVAECLTLGDIISRYVLGSSCPRKAIDCAAGRAHD